MYSEEAEIQKLGLVFDEPFYCLYVPEVEKFLARDRRASRLVWISGGVTNEDFPMVVLQQADVDRLIVTGKQ